MFSNFLFFSINFKKLKWLFNLYKRHYQSNQQSKMNGIEMAKVVQNMCHEWQLNRGLSDDPITGAFALYDFMKARGEDVSIVPAIAEGDEDDGWLAATMIVSVTSDIGEVTLVDTCEFTANKHKTRYITTLTALKAWMNEDGDAMDKEKQDATVKEFMVMMKLSLRIRSKDRTISESRTENCKKMKAYIDDEYKKYIMGFIKTAITGGGVGLPFTQYIMGVPLVCVLIPPNPSKYGKWYDATVFFNCSVLNENYGDQTVLAIGANVGDSPLKRQKTMSEMFECVEKIMAIFHTVKYDKLHGFFGGNMCMDRKSMNPPNIDDVCCVCHDPCIVKTKCAHTLCLQCWGSVIKAKYPDGWFDNGDGHINCPMCRQVLPLQMEIEDEVADVDKLD